MIKHFFTLLLISFMLGCQSNTTQPPVVIKEPLVAPIVIDSTLPFHTAAKVEVIAFPNRNDWDRTHKYDTLVKDGKLHFNTKMIKQRITLTIAQQQEAYDLLYNQDHCESSSFSMCYSPRHAFIFYDAKGTATTYMEVCFQCSKANMEDKYKWNEQCREMYQTLAQFVKRVGISNWLEQGEGKLY